jgi:hypothetical protein
MIDGTEEFLQEDGKTEEESNDLNSEILEKALADVEKYKGYFKKEKAKQKNQSNTTDM